MVLTVHRATERRVVVLATDRIHGRTARNQQLGDVDAVVVRSDVERVFSLTAFDVGRGAEIQQQLGGPPAVVFAEAKSGSDAWRNSGWRAISSRIAVTSSRMQH